MKKIATWIIMFQWGICIISRYTKNCRRKGAMQQNQSKCPGKVLYWKRHMFWQTLKSINSMWHAMVHSNLAFLLLTVRAREWWMDRPEKGKDNGGSCKTSQGTLTLFYSSLQLPIEFCFIFEQKRKTESSLVSSFQIVFVGQVSVYSFFLAMHPARDGIHTTAWPELLQEKCQILNPLHHKGTPILFLTSKWATDQYVVILDIASTQLMPQATHCLTNTLNGPWSSHCDKSNHYMLGIFKCVKML